MHADFWEIGASGRRYSREYVLAEIEKRYQQPHKDLWETSEFYCRALGPDLYLLTYTLIQDKIRKTRRLTIWQHSKTGWKIMFHQGTVVVEASDCCWCCGVYSAAYSENPMKQPFNAFRTPFRITGPLCRSKRHQMPRRHLRVLPSLTRPSLFAGD
jgi:hypothetical protein